MFLVDEEQFETNDGVHVDTDMTLRYFVNDVVHTVKNQSTALFGDLSECVELPPEVIEKV